VKYHKGVTSIFVVLEAFTGFASLFVEPLVIPPLTSIGMFLDLGIFATGLVAILYFSRQGTAKSGDFRHEEEEFKEEPAEVEREEPKFEEKPVEELEKEEDISSSEEDENEEKLEDDEKE
jgi:hypothetical protein